MDSNSSTLEYCDYPVHASFAHVAVFKNTYLPKEKTGALRVPTEMQTP